MCVAEGAEESESAEFGRRKRFMGPSTIRAAIVSLIVRAAIAQVQVWSSVQTETAIASTREISVMEEIP